MQITIQFPDKNHPLCIHILSPPKTALRTNDTINKTNGPIFVRYRKRNDIGYFSQSNRVVSRLRAEFRRRFPEVNAIDSAVFKFF